MLRNTLIFPILSEPAAIKARGLTVNYLLKTDEHRSTAEEMILELKTMQSEGLVMPKGGKWALTDTGLAAWMAHKLDNENLPATKPPKPHLTTTKTTVTAIEPPAQLQDLTELLAALGKLGDVNQLETKVELITQLHKWLNPDIGDVFGEIIDELEKLQDIATMAKKCLSQVARS